MEIKEIVFTYREYFTYFMQVKVVFFSMFVFVYFLNTFIILHKPG